MAPGGSRRTPGPPGAPRAPGAPAPPRQEKPEELRVDGSAEAAGILLHPTVPGQRVQPLPRGADPLPWRGAGPGEPPHSHRDAARAEDVKILQRREKKLLVPAIPNFPSYSGISVSQPVFGGSRWQISLKPRISSQIQALVVGVLTAVGDHVLKPLLAAAFHSLLQPLLLFLLKVLGGIRDLVDPVLDVVARLCSQLAVLLRAVRLVEIRLHPDTRTGPVAG
ncbi:uncharacterized protein LOC126644690 isoform X2 [Myiozetetes cayanensis]|uniref:uncharacterized protein LOC126644690 isoform X2 n=1 Tax=Myiozetetes cayanensis TaxID=478635 RepID=UPI00215EE2EC|nr:uncharacterized protein LOC126644690 isoform X2 [Myiozetetes cayanensis]